MLRFHSCFAALLVGLVGVSHAAEWTWQWSMPAGTPAPKAEVTPLKYGKTWAYAVEIDDGPAGTLSVVQPLLAGYGFTDAPPGMAGGKRMPFVGGSAVIVGSMGTTNNTILQWDDVRKLQQLGWGVLNHSFYHAGHEWGDPPEILTREQLRTDLFWSQTLLALETGGRAPTHFVYPNGYLAYREYLPEFGLRSGSRVGGGPANPKLYDAATNLLDIDRAYLDEGAWFDGGKGKPLSQFPPDDPPTGSLHIDFTHGIDEKPDSLNHRRWVERLDTIASRYGEKGKDTVWCAPTSAITEYVSARTKAELIVTADKLTVRLPDDISGASLTIHLKGLPAGAAAPAGATLYQQADDAWLTTPTLGQPGSPAPMPHVKRIYEGPVKDLTWEKPIALAGVRLLQGQPAADGFELQISVRAPRGEMRSLVPPGKNRLAKTWGRWFIYPVVPNGPAMETRALHVSQEKALEKMEVWAVEDSGKAKGSTPATDQK